MAGCPDLFDLSARLWLRAYPQRWRVTFGADLLGTLADVAPEGARTVPVREGLAVLRAGWALRWREHPPFWRWLAYRTFERRLPDRYRYWVIDDLLGSLYELRVLSVLLPYVLLVVVLAGGPMQLVGESSPLPDGMPGLFVAWCGFVVLMSKALKIPQRRMWSKSVGGGYPTALLPLWRRIAVRRAARPRP